MTSKKAASTKRVALPRPFSYSRQFLKDFERFNRAARADMKRLKTLMMLLIANEQPLDAEWKDHPIDKGDFAGTGTRDAHVHGDFLLLYRITPDRPETVVFERIGTHSELFWIDRFLPANGKGRIRNGGDDVRVRRLNG